METGGCLCGKVRYRLDDRPVRATHCHCSQCRKQHGAAFATYALARRSSVSIEDAEGVLTEFRSSAKATRSFCRVCGSSLFWRGDDSPKWIDVALGTLDGEPSRLPDAHIYVGSKAAWVAIADGLPCYEESLPAQDDR